jgi:UPF0755 protein
LIRVLTQSLKIVSILVVAVIVVGGSVTFFDYWSDRTASKENGTPVKVQITAEDDSGSVADKLADQDLIRWTWYFEGRMRLSGDELKPGTYTLRKGMSVNDIIRAITVNEDGESNVEEDAEGETEDAVSGEALSITFIEGQRIEEFAITAEEAGLPGGRQAFLDAAANPENRTQWSFLADVPADASLEGFLFPDTYTLGEGETADDLIYKMLANFDVKFTNSMREQASAEGLSIREAVTLASLVEREAAVAEERPVIAAVYLNRIEQEMTLDADPILQYNLGDQGDGNWWPTLNTELLEQAKSAGFDTYSEVGLPPGPIANPGSASLQAVVEPADVTYLFFVAKNDGSGEHVFADTLEEQTQNICEWNPDYEECGGSGTAGDDQVIEPADDDDVGWRQDHAA